MHPALRKGPLFCNKKTPPPIFHFLQKHPTFSTFLQKNNPHFPLCYKPPILFPAYGPVQICWKFHPRAQDAQLGVLQ